MADITGVIKGGRKSILGLSQNHASVTLGIIKDGNKYLVGSPAPAVPDGKTVTPINDVTIWQQCAGIANPTYTTLAEVLADTGILQTLMASDNAVDYLVRCKEWCGLGLVPTMTSDTAPSGVASADPIQGDNPNYSAYKAFDGDDSTFWASGAPSGYIQYEFPTPKNITKVYWKDLGSLRTGTYKFQGSNDGFVSDTHDLYSGTASSQEMTISFGNLTAYKYYRFNHLSGADNIAIVTLQFYSDNICENQYAMYYIGQNNYASNTLLADSDWCSAICNSTYFESVLNVKVPVMTSNTTPSGECFRGAETVGTPNSDASEPYNCFDGSSSGTWTPYHNPSYNAWIGYVFEHPILIKKVVLKNKQYNGTYRAKTCCIKASNTKSDFVSISSDFTLLNNDNEQSFIVDNSLLDYKAIIVFIKDSYADTQSSTGLNKIQFYGREDV